MSGVCPRAPARTTAASESVIGIRRVLPPLPSTIRSAPLGPLDQVIGVHLGYLGAARSGLVREAHHHLHPRWGGRDRLAPHIVADGERQGRPFRAGGQVLVGQEPTDVSLPVAPPGELACAGPVDAASSGFQWGLAAKNSSNMLTVSSDGISTHSSRAMRFTVRRQVSREAGRIPAAIMCQYHSSITGVQPAGAPNRRGPRPPRRRHLPKITETARSHQNVVIGRGCAPPHHANCAAVAHRSAVPGDSAAATRDR